MNFRQPKWLESISINSDTIEYTLTCRTKINMDMREIV